eukprot:TRINITY_DN3390_c0_g1_i3.p1 TRINITY_DN3390_c0_g1~~TRINITY_DN3390_c0_g1_i3.p1  ORF type:complete len:138 (+),score=2.68 TRINITY_DN3390_c0_g1_i3:54-467(+)
MDFLLSLRFQLLTTGWTLSALMYASWILVLHDAVNVKSAMSGWCAREALESAAVQPREESVNFSRANSDRQSPCQLSGLRILVVGEGYTSQEATEGALLALGAEVETASSAQATIQLLAKALKPYHLVLLETHVVGR